MSRLLGRTSHCGVCVVSSSQCHLFLYAFVCVCVCGSRSVVSNSATPWAAAHQAPLSKGFSRQEYWSGLPFPSPGNLPDPGIKPTFPALQVASLLSEPPGKSPQFSDIIKIPLSLGRKLRYTDLPLQASICPATVIPLRIAILVTQILGSEGSILSTDSLASDQIYSKVLLPPLGSSGRFSPST